MGKIRARVVFLHKSDECAQHALLKTRQILLRLCDVEGQGGAIGNVASVIMGHFDIGGCDA